MEPKRVECPVCGHKFALKRDGTVRAHQPKVLENFRAQRCAGSGQPPAGVTTDPGLVARMQRLVAALAGWDQEDRGVVGLLVLEAAAIMREIENRKLETP